MVANNKAEWVSSARHEGALFAAPLNGRTMVNRWRVAHCIDSFTGSFSAVHGRPFGGAGAYRWGSLEQSDPLSSPFFDALLSAFLVRLRCHSTMLLMVNRLLETCPRPALDIVESLSLSLLATRARLRSSWYDMIEARGGWLAVWPGRRSWWSRKEMLFMDFLLEEVRYNNFLDLEIWISFFIPFVLRFDSLCKNR